MKIITIVLFILLSLALFGQNCKTTYHLCPITGNMLIKEDRTVINMAAIPMYEKCGYQNGVFLKYCSDYFVDQDFYYQNKEEFDSLMNETVREYVILKMMENDSDKVIKNKANNELLKIERIIYLKDRLNRLLEKNSSLPLKRRDELCNLMRSNPVYMKDEDFCKFCCEN